MRAEVGMPRSPTITTSAMRKWFLSLSTWAATVMGSARLPSKTSTATGQPSRLVSSPNSIWGRPRLPSRL